MNTTYWLIANIALSVVLVALVVWLVVEIRREEKEAMRRRPKERPFDGFASGWGAVAHKVACHEIRYHPGAGKASDVSARRY